MEHKVFGTKENVNYIDKSSFTMLYMHSAEKQGSLSQR